MRSVGSGFSGLCGGSRLLILMYHRVLARPDPLLPDVPDAAIFDAQMAQLARVFRPCPLDQAVDQLKAGTLPARSVCVTFDDGYADNHDVALPILQRHGVPATIFVAPGFLDGGYMWNDAVIETVRGCDVGLNLETLGLGRYRTGTWEDKSRAVAEILGHLKYLPQQERAEKVEALQRVADAPSPNGLMLTSGQVKALHQAGQTIGAHTMTHPILTRTTDTAVESELADSKAYLEGLLGAPVELFAYPNGNPDKDYARRHVAAARAAGFKAAVNVSWGYADADSDCYQLPRIWPWDRTPIRFTLRLWRTYLTGKGRVASV